MHRAPLDQSRFPGKCPRWTGDSERWAKEGRVTLQEGQPGGLQCLERLLLGWSRPLSVPVETHFAYVSGAPPKSQRPAEAEGVVWQCWGVAL